MNKFNKIVPSGLIIKSLETNNVYFPGDLIQNTTIEDALTSKKFKIFSSEEAETEHTQILKAVEMQNS